MTVNNYEQQFAQCMTWLWKSLMVQKNTDFSGALKKKKIYISKNNHMQDPYFGPFFSPFLVVVLFQFCFLFSLSPCIFLHLDQDSFI